MRVLIIEDNGTLSEVVAEGLVLAKMLPTVVADGYRADEMLRDAQKSGQYYDAVVLDLSLPGMDGMDVLKRLRFRNDMTPVLVLTARSTLVDRVDGLDQGADDYLTKPFDIAELIARVRVIGRRRQPWQSLMPSIGNLSLDLTTGSFFIESNELPLTPRARAILNALFRRQGASVHKNFLANLTGEVSSVPSVDIQISRLRKTLIDAGAAVTVKTQYGYGYLLAAKETEDACE